MDVWKSGIINGGAGAASRPNGVSRADAPPKGVLEENRTRK